MKKLSDLFITFVVLGIIGFGIYKIMHRAVTDHSLKTEPVVQVKAVIIDDRNYFGNSRVKPEFTYSYMFTADGKTYTGNSNNKNVKVGDSVDVEYVKGSPGLNKPLHPTE